MAIPLQATGMYTGHQTRTQCHVLANVIFLAQCSIAYLARGSRASRLKSQWSVVFTKTFVFTLRAAWHTVHLL